MSLGRLVVDLLLKTGSFESDLGRASKATKKRMKEIEKAATAAGAVLGTALVAGATAAGYAIKAAIDQADQLNEISQKIGIPTDVLSGLNYAAKLAGVATEELQGGLVKMIKFQADAAQGGKDSTAIFQTLGIAIKDSAGGLRDSSAVFSDFADIFATLQDGPEKTALAIKVFGRAGAELIPLLNEGRQGIQAYTDELDRLGGTVTPATARAADQFNDNLDKLKVAVGGLALQVASDLLPDLVSLTDEFVKSYTQGDNLATTAHSIADGFRLLAASAAATVDVVQMLTSRAISLYNVLEVMSTLNPGAALSRFFGGNDSTGENLRQMIAAGEMAREEADSAFARFGTESASSKPAGFGKGIRGGGGNGFSSASPSGTAPDLSGLFSSPLKATGGGGSKKRDTGAEDALRELQRRLEEVTRASGDFNSQLEDMQAEIGGPLAKALLDHNRALADLDELAQKGEISSEKLAEAKAAETALYERDKKAIEERLDVGGNLLKDMQFEYDLITMTNAERATAIQLRGMDAESIQKYGAQIAAANQGLEDARIAYDNQVNAMDEFRSNFSDNVTDVLTGAKSIGDAFKSLADTVIAQIARMIANRLTESLFGAMGGTGGGSQGDLLSSLFGMFLGGSSSGSSFGIPMPGSGTMPGFAHGTDYAPGGWAMVGERGPELVNLPRGSKVFPNGRGPGGGQSVVQHINVPSGTTKKTASYLAAKAADGLRVAQRDS